MIQLLRFGVIVLGTIMVSLLLFLGLARFTKRKIFAASSWTTNFIIIIMAISGLLGMAIGGIDSMIFDPKTNLYTIGTVGLILEGDVLFGVYWDATATSAVISMEWGELEPGQTGNVTLYIKNEGASNLYAEAVWNTTTWDPPGADQYFDLTWDFDTKMLRPGFAQRTLLQLHVHDDIAGITDFSFDIVITGDNEPFPE